MGELHDKMLMMMQMRNFSERTIQAYTGQMKAFVRMHGRSPDELGEDEICRYLHYLRREKKVSWSSINIGYSALKYFYVHVLDKEWNVKKIPRPKSEKRLPVVLSTDEIKVLLNATFNFKHRAILMTIYSAGLRLNEALHLKISDIDSKRMQIRVSQGKGKKDRYTLLSTVLLKLLRAYYKMYKPKSWLFEGNTPEGTLDPGCIQRAIQKAKKKLGLPSLLPSTPFDTHLLPTF
jgi:integrase/recombinase XerD